MEELTNDDIMEFLNGVCKNKENHKPVVISLHQFKATKFPRKKKKALRKYIKNISLLVQEGRIFQAVEMIR